MTPEEIASMLAQANANVDQTVIDAVDADGILDPNVALITPNVPAGNMPDENGVIRGTPTKQPTPEEALALMDKLEGKGTETPDAPEVIEELPEEVDLSTLPLAEQIKALQAKLDIENGVEVNPLAEVESKITEAGLDLKDFEKQYIEEGQIDEASMLALKEAGFNDVAVKAYIDTKVAHATEKANQAITKVMGSKESFTEMSEWMGKNLTQGELDKYNKGVSGEHFEAYLSSMYNKFREAVPAVKPKVRTVRKGANEAVATSVGYNSQAEMIRDMQNPRYKNDAKFRQAVMTKVSMMK